MKRRTKEIDQTEKFKRDTQGMTNSQKFEYLNMSDPERKKFLESLRIKNQEKGDKTKEKTKDKEHILVKIKNKKAKVVQRNPFTIQLKYATGEAKQPIIFALDPGYKHVGFSTTTKKRELICGEVILRTDIPDKLKEKKMYRTNRRCRNTRYRKPRFENRHIKEGWLPPSIQHKLDTYVRLVHKFENILPITGITIEIAPFDTQKMQNPEIQGIEYQQGTLQGYEIREYLLDKWGRKCAYCKIENVPFETEHIIPTSRGGTDRVSNLTIACHDCNQKKGNMTATEFGHSEIQIQARQSLKAATFMNVVRSRLVDIIKKEFPQYHCDSTYGYITKHDRIKLGLEKSHVNDAFVIAGGIDQIRSKPYQVVQNRRNNRSLQLNRKGFKPSIRKKRYEFQPGDLVKRLSMLQTTGWGEKISKRDRTSTYTVKGIFNYGEYIRLANYISADNSNMLSGKDIDIKTDDVKICKYGKGLLFQLRDEHKKDKVEKKGNTEKKDKVLSKKEQKIIDMKKQILIDNAWN